MDLGERILKADDLPRERVEVPEWGCTVYVRTLNGSQREEHENSLVKLGKRGGFVSADLSNMRARLLVRCLEDESGKLIFKLSQAEALGKKSAAVLDRLYDIACRLSRMKTGDDEQEEERRKNSGRAGDDGSTTLSPLESAAPSANCSGASAATS